MNGWRMTGGSHALSVTTRSGGFMDRLRMVSELTKCHLTVFIALSAVFGQVIASGRFSKETLAAGGGVWLLSAGAAVLNNIQDRDHDRGFVRTRHRCLPQRKIRVSSAAMLGLVLTGAGLAVLFWYPDTPVPGFLGLLALGCYNGLYTPLKKKSCLAVWPGIACGMLPPAVGWSMVPSAASAGTGPDLLMVMAVLGLWQVPHFLVLRAGAQVSGGGESKNSRRAMDRPDGLDGNSDFRPPPSSVFPCMARRWTAAELQVQVLIWVSLYSLAMLLFLIRGGVASAAGSMGLGGMALALPAGIASSQLRGPRRSAKAGVPPFTPSLFVFIMLGTLDRPGAGFFSL